MELFCTLFHTEAARLFGAPDAEIREAAHLAEHTVAWSLSRNGMRENEERFAAVGQLRQVLAGHDDELARGR